MVNLPSPCAVGWLAGEQARGFRYQAEKGIHANRIVGAPDQADTVTIDGGLHAFQFAEPAGGTHHDVHAQRGDAIDVLRDCGGDGKINRDVDALKVGGRHAFERGIVEFVEFQRYGETVFRRELLDEPTHLAVADYGEFVFRRH